MPAKSSLQTEPRVCDGRWHHVAITFDGETKKATLWVDYEKCGELILNGPLNYVDGRPFRIGNFGERGMVGWVDEVRISDCVLDVSEFLDARPPEGVLLDEHEPAETLYRFRMGDIAELPSSLEGVEDCAWCQRLLSSRRLNYANWQKELLEDESASAPSDICEVPSSHVFFAANATNDFADARSISFKGSDACKVLLPSAEAICGGDFTAELFARARVGQTFCGLIRQTRGGSADVLWQIGLDLHANVVFSSWDGSKVVNVGYNATLDDGCWHHLAVTYHENTKHIEMFFDGTLANSTTLTYGLADYATSDRGLLIGRKTGGFDGEIDEVRVTGRVLSPSEFLSFPGEKTKMPLIHFGFNADWSNDLRSIVPVGDAMHAAYVGGVDPAISAGRMAGKYLYSGAPQKAETFWSTNTHYVSICTGKVTLVSSSSPFFSCVRSTTEAFVRFSTPTIMPYSDVLAYSVANTRIWTIRIKENKPYVLFCGTDYAFNPDSDAKVVNDGGWHHLAVTCEQNETATETVVELYVDGIRYAGGTASRGMPTGYSTDAYSLVAGTLNGSNYPVFDVDEVRMSPRILDSAEFLHFGRYFLPSGMAIFIR